MERPIDIIVAGYFGIDIIPAIQHGAEKVGDLLSPGKIVNVGEATTAPGGAVPNTGLSLKKLGLNVELMGKVGDDRFGKALMDIVQAVDPGQRFRGLKVDASASTSYTIALCIPGIDRIFLTHAGASGSFCENDIDFELVKEARVFHLGYPPLMRSLYADGGQELLRILKHCKAMDVTTSIDMSLPDPDSESGAQDWLTILKRWGPHTDLLLPSIEESLYFLDREKFLRMRHALGPDECLLDHLTPDDIIPLAQALLDLGPAVVMIKCGYKGLYIATADKDRVARMGAGRPADVDGWAGRQLWHPVYQVKDIVAALGSGDCAIAGFLAGYLKGYSVEDCLRYGNAAGSRNVTVTDALSWNQGFDDLTERIRDWPSDSLDIALPGWRQEREMWMGPADNSFAGK